MDIGNLGDLFKPIVFPYPQLSSNLMKVLFYTKLTMDDGAIGQLLRLNH